MKKMFRAIGLFLWIAATGLSLAGCATYSGPAAVTERGLGYYYQLVFNTSGTMLAANETSHGNIEIYQTENLSLITSRKIGKWNLPNSMIFSPDGKYLAFDSANSTKIEIWELQSDKTAAALSFDKRKIMACIFSPDSKFFSVLCDDGTLLRWDAQDWTQMPYHPAPSFWNAIGVSKYSYSVFSNDGNFLIVQGKNSLWLWNLQNDSASPMPNPFGQHIDLTARTTVNRDFTRIAGTCFKGLSFAVRTWDASTGQPTPLEDSEFGLFANILLFINFELAPSLTFSPDGTLLAATLASGGKWGRWPESRIWRLDTGAVVWTLPNGLGEACPTLAFSPDGELLAVGGNSIRLFRVKDILSKNRF